MEEYKIPKEHQPLPPEHNIPEEFPISKPQAVVKKKSSARRWMAVLASSFMVLQVMFTYFVPPTVNDPTEPSVPGITEPGYIDPGYTDPGGSGSGSTDKPSYDIGNFRIESMASDKNDSQVKGYLETAAGYFEKFDYVRAALSLYQSMRYYDSGFAGEELTCIGYSIINGTAQNFDASEADAVHVYYADESITFENKIGELEKEYGTRATMVRIQNTDKGRRFYVVTVWLSHYGVFDGGTQCNAEYIEGIFANDGTSESCSRTVFSVFDSPDYPDMDGKYGVWGQERYTGSTANDAFMNGTLLETVLTYEEGQGIVNNPEQAPLNIHFQCLDEQGVVDLAYPTLIDFTQEYNSELNDKFYNDPTVRYLAYTYSLCYKYDGSEEHGWIGNRDLTQPLLPLHMHAALCIGQLITDAGGEGSEPAVPSVDYSAYVPGLIDASDFLMADDYIGASIAMTDLFAEYYVSEPNQILLVYENGQIKPFADQDLTDGTGTYIRLQEEIVLVYNEKAEDYDPEMHLQATLIHVTELSTGESETQIVTVDMPYYFLGQGKDQATYCSSTAIYFEGGLDQQLASQQAKWITYTMESSDRENTKNYRDGYYFSKYKEACGAVASNHFYGKVQYRFDGYLSLTDDKTSVVPKVNLENHVFALDLDRNGVLDMKNIEFHDARAYEPGSTEAVQANSDFSLDDCPYDYQILRNTYGGFTLRVKAMKDTNGERVNLLLNIFDDTWEQEQFPLSNTMDVWSYFHSLIQ